MHILTHCSSVLIFKMSSSRLAQQFFYIISSVGAPANSKDGDGNSNTSETSNRSEEEAQEKTEKFKNEGFGICDEVVTLLPNTRDNRDFTSGNTPDEVQEDAQEPDSYKRANSNKETDGNVHSKEPNQTEHTERMSQPQWSTASAVAQAN